ncbi:MAG: hypothetical protein DCC67_17940, partial [Planctomycetota bacterium]
TAGERLSVSQLETLLKQTGISIFDGDDEDDNVPNTHQAYRRLDIMALGNAVLSGGKGDLTIPGGMTADAAVPVGGRARASFSIANQGPSDSGEFIGQFVLSTDPVIDAADMPLSTLTDSVEAGAVSAHHGAGVVLPATVAPGDYYLGLVLDVNGAVDEGSETNNVAIAPLQVVAEAPEAWLADAATGVKVAAAGGLLDFGLVEQGAPDAVKTLRIANDGSQTLELANLALPPNYVVAGFPASLAPLEAVDFTIALHAGEQLGNASGGATFTTNDADEGLFEINLAGLIVEADDHGDGAAEATAVGVPTVADGVILPPGDVDWFVFASEAGKTYRIEALLGSLADSVLRLIDVNGATVLLTDDDGGAGLGSRLDWTAPSAGNYFLEVAAKPGAFGTYQLLIQDDDDHGDDPENASPLTIPIATAGVIHVEGDADWFRLPTIAQVEYRVSVDLSTLSGAKVQVFGADGVSLYATGYGGNGVPAVAAWTATDEGPYYVQVTGYVFAADLPVGNDALAPRSTVPGGPTGEYAVTAKAVSALPGDYDGNSAIDGQDFLQWQRTVGTKGDGGEITFDAGGFEDYRLADLDGQQRWKKLGSPDGSAVVQNVVVAGGNRAVQIDRAPNADNWWGVPLGPAAPKGPHVLVAWNMRVRATGAENGGLGPFLGVQAYDDHSRGLGLIAALGVDATTMDVVYQREGDGIIVETGAKASPDVWYSYAILMDFAEQQFTIYFEGQPLATNKFVDLGVADVELDRLTDADLTALPAQANQQSQAMAGTAYVDDFRIVHSETDYLFPADGNGDGAVDALDLDVWQETYGVSYAAAPAAGALGVSSAPRDNDVAWSVASSAESPEPDRMHGGLAVDASLAWLAQRREPAANQPVRPSAAGTPSGAAHGTRDAASARHQALAAVLRPGAELRFGVEPTGDARQVDAPSAIDAALETLGVAETTLGELADAWVRLT